MLDCGGVTTLLQVAGSSGWAGGERYLLNLADHLDKNRFELKFILPEPGPLEDELRRRGLETAVVHLTPLVNPLALFSLARVIRRMRPQLIQSHGARSNFYTRLAGAISGIPVLATVHNSLYDYPVSHFRKSIYLWMDRLAASFSRRILCVCESHRQDLIRMGCQRDLISTIHLGVDVEAFSPEKQPAGESLRKELGLGERAVVSLIGRLTPQKGHIHFLRALESIASLDFVALVVGDGPLRADLEREAREILGERVIFTGLRRDIPEILQATDVLVLASVSEGFPYVVLEAMAMEKAIVATRVSGVPEMLTDGKEGLLVPAKDERAMALAIDSLIQNPSLRKELGEAARRRAERDFSVERMISQTQSLYESCLKHSP